jgi:hypothetical protein
MFLNRFIYLVGNLDYQHRFMRKKLQHCVKSSGILETGKSRIRSPTTMHVCMQSKTDGLICVIYSLSGETREVLYTFSSLEKICCSSRIQGSVCLIVFSITRRIVLMTVRGVNEKRVKISLILYS